LFKQSTKTKVTDVILNYVTKCRPAYEIIKYTVSKKYKLLNTGLSLSDFFFGGGGGGGGGYVPGR